MSNAVDLDRQIADELGIQYSEPVPVPLSNIDFVASDKAQTRSAHGVLVNEENVERLSEANGELPAGFGLPGAKGVIVVVGRHRLEVAKRKRAGFIRLHILDADTPASKVRSFSVRSNATHGLPVARAELIDMAASDFINGLGNQQEVADRYGVSQPAVSQRVKALKAYEVCRDAGVNQGVLGRMTAPNRVKMAAVIEKQGESFDVIKPALVNATPARITAAIDDLAAGKDAEEVKAHLIEQAAPVVQPTQEPSKLAKAHLALDKSKDTLAQIEPVRQRIDRMNVEQIIHNLNILEGEGHTVSRQRMIDAAWEAAEQAQAAAAKATALAKVLSGLKS